MSIQGDFLLEKFPESLGQEADKLHRVSVWRDKTLSSEITEEGDWQTLQALSQNPKGLPSTSKEVAKLGPALNSLTTDLIKETGTLVLSHWSSGRSQRNQSSLEEYDTTQSFKLLPQVLKWKVQHSMKNKQSRR